LTIADLALNRCETGPAPIDMRPCSKSQQALFKPVIALRKLRFGPKKTRAVSGIYVEIIPGRGNDGLPKNNTNRQYRLSRRARMWSGADGDMHRR
jgi:hypothetical protein